MEFPSKLIARAVDEMSRLPGVGKKTALRFVLYLLKENNDTTRSLTGALAEMRENIRYCSRCYNISDEEICAICSNPRRDQSMICLVEDLRDVLAIENTSQYQGVYHVLGGVISPIDGVGPDDLNIAPFIERLKNSGEVKEIILALSPTMEGDTTSFYLTKKLKDLDLRITTIARGVPIGGELEYTDEITLGRSIITRTDYKG
jgi:recombination protein RecR